MNLSKLLQKGRFVKKFGHKLQLLRVQVTLYNYGVSNKLKMCSEGLDWCLRVFHGPGPGSYHDQNSSIVLWKFATNITRYCHELSCCKVILMRRVTQQRSYNHELSTEQCDASPVGEMSG